jgi:hypothetical protein
MRFMVGSPQGNCVACVRLAGHAGQLRSHQKNCGESIGRWYRPILWDQDGRNPENNGARLPGERVFLLLIDREEWIRSLSICESENEGKMRAQFNEKQALNAPFCAFTFHPCH